MTTNAIFSDAYAVRSHHPSPDGCVCITTVCDFLQDMAARHADILGFGFHDMQRLGRTWLLARLHVVMERLPRLGESVEITTWPSGNERLSASRDFVIGLNGQDAGLAATNWVAMDLTTRRPVPPETLLASRLIPQRDRALRFPTKSVRRLTSGEHVVSLAARRSDIDVNGHVNNVRYAEFCLEAVPADFLEERRCCGLDIQFRSESTAGETFSSFCSPLADEPGALLHGVRRSDGVEAVRMKSWWRPK